MRLRPEAIAFCLAALLGAGLSSLVVRGPVVATGAVASPTAAPAARQGRERLRKGDLAVRRGDLHAADKHYRRAWDFDATRPRAADALRSLHEHPRFELRADEKSVSEAQALLGEGFWRLETKHFVILSDASRDWTRQKAALLERAHHQYFRFVDRLEFPVYPPQHKLLCILFEDHAMYQAFARTHDGVNAPWIAGYYAGLSNRVVFYDDRSGPAFRKAFEQLDDYERDVSDLRREARSLRDAPDESASLSARAAHLTRRVASERTRLEEEAAHAAQAKTIHEAIHLLAFNTGLQSRAHQYPFWLTEGLAVAFETDQPDAAFGPDRPTERREQEFQRFLQEGGLIELEALVAMNAPIVADAEGVDALYSQAFTLFTHLVRKSRRTLVGYMLDIRDEPPGRITPPRHVELFTAHFGRPASVERRWLRSLGADRSALASHPGGE